MRAPAYDFRGTERFRVIRQLGEGGAGVVYEAEDVARGQRVALKTLKQHDLDTLYRLKREFRALADLSHANLVHLYDMVLEGDSCFFTMELVRGVGFLAYVRGEDYRPDEADAVSPTGPTMMPATAPAARADTDLSLGPADAPPSRGSEPRVVEPVAFDEARLRAALKQLAVGVAALHEAGKVHRDIKPSNLLVTPEGRVVLLDFGLVAEATESRQSSDAGGVGTVEYMAPEQALSGQVTTAADWYSVGVVLFEALTGALPHTGRTPYEIILRKQQYMAAPPRQLVPDAPPDLDALCAALLSQEPEDRPVARDIFDRLGITEDHGLVLEPSPLSLSLSGRPPFVGRAEELATLRDAFDQVRDGPRVLLVSGVSGVGKSQLVEEFLERLAEEQPDTWVLSGRCYEREVLSYKAFDGIAESLSRALAHLPPDEARALMPPRAALLARLFPVLKRVEAIAGARLVADVPDPQDQRRRMFAALRSLFQRIAQRWRLVWYIDDLQWTDADSLVLLQDLLAHEEGLPVLLVATMRPVDSESRRALVAQLEELAPLQRMVVKDLPPADARTLAGLLMPGQEASVLDAVAADAGGHPLFLHELARHQGASRAGPRPDATLEEMLTARIDGLPSPARGLLEVVCLSGGPLTQEVAALAAEQSDSAQVKAARILRAAHLVRTDGVSRTDRIVTYHDRVREHVTARLDQERRRRLHERLALALEQTGAATHNPRALVRHASAAGRTELAATYALSAARIAAGALAFNQAAEFFSAALQLGTHDEDSARSIRLDLARALANAGRGPEAAQTFMAAAEGAEPAVRLDCQRHAADQWIITGHLDQGMQTLRTLLADIGEPTAATPQRALVRVLWNRSRLRLRGMRHKTRTESQVPVEVLRRLDVLRAAAHGLAMVDNIRGADFNGRFLRLALRTGEPLRLIQALATEAVFLASQGGRSAKRGRRIFARLQGLAEQHPDDAEFQTWLKIADGAVTFFEGRFVEAEATLREGEALAVATTGNTYERNNLRVFRVHSLRQHGAVRTNARLIAESARSGRQRGDRYLEATLRLLQVQALLAQDRVRSAHQQLSGVDWAPLEAGFQTQHWHELEARVELALYEGTAREALEALAPTFAELQRSLLLRVNTIGAIAVELRGRLLYVAVQQGQDPAPARAEVARGVKRLARGTESFARVFEGLQRATRAALAPSPDPEEVVACLRQAADHAEQANMALHREAARYALGAFLGGDEGAALRAGAEAWAAGEEIARPDRFFRMVVPHRPRS